MPVVLFKKDGKREITLVRVVNNAGFYYPGTHMMLNWQSFFATS